MAIALRIRGQSPRPKRRMERAAPARKMVGLVAAFLLLQSCDTTTYTGTDKIDFVNRTVIEPLPTPNAAAATPAAVAGSVGGIGLVEEVGVLVDGRLGPSGPHVNDAGFTSQEARLAIPNRIWNFFDIFYPDRRREVIAFTRDRRPEFVYTPWTGGEDIFTVTFKPRIEIPLTIWIVTGPAATPPATPFSVQRLHAMEAIIRTLSIWYQERMGLGFNDVRILNATGNPQAAARSAVPNNPTEEDTWRPLREQIGFEDGRLNLYWVTTVNNSTTFGWSNFGPQIAMGQNTGDELLSHEIGHALSLTHVNELSNFDQTNVMHNASSTRQFLTEGQIVRAHVNSKSILWRLFVDVGQQPPGRDCEPEDFDGKCPALDRRVWADGSFPANNYEMCMRFVLATLAIAVFSAAVPGAGIAQERPVQLETLPPASRNALLAWLQRDCAVAATPEELMRLRALSAVAQEPLIEAYRQGPPPDLERTYEAAFSEAFAARSTALGREGAKLFGAEDAARLQNVDRDAYVRRRLEAARLNYRTNAVLGLGVVGARAALPLLNQIAGEADNPMREAARSSIATLREGQPPRSQQPR